MYRIIPPPIRRGERIWLIAPSSYLLEKQLDRFIRSILSAGYVLKFGQFLLAKSGMQAGTDQQRLDDLQKALDDPEAKIIWCARGGYGLTQIIDKLNFTVFKKYPKWIIGFSDVTVLHLAVEKLGFMSIHGAMATAFEQTDMGSEIAINILLDLISGKTPIYALETHERSRAGVAKGVLVGGNLCLINHQLATPTQVCTEEKILFIEETGEQLYRIDRMVGQLKRSGLLANLSGCVVGQFSAVPTDSNNAFGKDAYEIILDYLAEYSYPIAFGFPVGHTPKNFPLIHGAKAKLTVSEHTTILQFMDI